ncbi:RNA-binding protein [Psychrosphaera sp. B3R10]|uniref:RNA recognition motif domain-containing protein n=1 Tax=unclassified Psychrosphaera TaxID=2641570 RepID=UPI001C097496|nr:MULTISPECIES: RNA-binding protein [unclassified Psychrosphaera]MBU2883147.1 RNA-binding protein [Psychrosphaera sp. I2R16]MBU2988603.1 RNA-binding protein [Psychrosphaera sp. B3R10]MDO6719666.1 RNA-binding protein [Psychrosphaera sp. 1_MG-2023]
MKIIARNLSRSTTEEQLTEAFTQFAELEYCTLVLDKVTGKSKGFGFVEINDDKKALLAIVKLNGTKLDGKVIRVKKAEDQ